MFVCDGDEYMSTMLEVFHRIFIIRLNKKKSLNACNRLGNLTLNADFLILDRSVIVWYNLFPVWNMELDFWMN